MPMLTCDTYSSKLGREQEHFFLRAGDLDCYRLRNRVIYKMPADMVADWYQGQ